MKNWVADRVALLLLNQRRHGLPINPLRLRYNYNIKFDTLENYAKVTNNTIENLKGYSDLTDGITLIHGDLYIVLLNETANCYRQFFTVAHEVGHIVLEHKNDNEQEEEQANTFAAELLMPRVLVKKLCEHYSRKDYLMISRVFGVSKTAMMKRFDDCAGKYSPSENEEKIKNIYNVFLPLPNQPIITI